MEVIEKHNKKKFIVFNLITDIENPEMDSPDCKMVRDLKIGTPSYKSQNRCIVLAQDKT